MRPPSSLHSQSTTDRIEDTPLKINLCFSLRIFSLAVLWTVADTTGPRLENRLRQVFSFVKRLSMRQNSCPCVGETPGETSCRGQTDMFARIGLRGFSHRHFADAWELLLRHLPRECGVGFAQKVIIRFFPSAHHSLDPKGVFQLNVGTMPACIPAIPEFYRSIMLCIIWRELIGRMQ